LLTRLLARLLQTVEVRRDERARTALVFFYLLCVLMAYYVLKPSSRSLFLTRFDKEHLPYLYLVIAVSGGVMAALYARVASRWSLRAAIEGSVAAALICLIGLWQLLLLEAAWVYYLFNVWVSLFSLVLVSQGWLLASHVFDPREAKRVYPVLAAGAVLGAALGGSLTAQFATRLGTRNLVLVSSVFIALAFAAYRFLVRQHGVNLDQTSAEAAPAEGYSPVEILSSVVRVKHLRVIVGLILVTYMVDQLVDYQFNVIAKQSRQGDALTAFLGGFYGIWLNTVTFVLQIFVTSIVVNLTGIGGTLLIIPAAIGAASFYMLLSPGIAAAGATRIAEAALRYSFNRTGMELLYLPLPDELRQKTKTFVDVFVDRAGRGAAALLILAAGWIFHDNLQVITLIVLALCGGWIALAVYARKEYIATVRKRLESRRLDLESMRIPYQDPSLLQMLATAARSGNARAAGYAIALLDEVPSYPLEPLALRLIEDAAPSVRAQLFEIAPRRRWSSLLPAARKELTLNPGPALAPALRFLSICGTGPDLLHIPEMLGSSDSRLVEAAVLAATHAGHIPLAWVESALASPDPDRRRLAVQAVALYPEHATRLLIPRLSDRSSAVRMATQDILAGHAEYTAPAMAALVRETSAPIGMRMAAIRALGRSASPEAAGALRMMVSSPDLAVRGGAVRALGRLQESSGGSVFALGDVAAGVRLEAREYFWLHSALSGLRGGHSSSPALELLCRTMEERMLRGVERVFRLLGLRYPPKDIEVAWKAYRRRQPNQLANALEFLDNILEYDVKRLVLPLLEEDSIDRQALLLFGFEPLTPGAALRVLIREGDAWLAACATAAAGELGISEAEPDIRAALEAASPMLRPVAEQALARLAPGENT
jgi:ATP/ADP translocase